MSDVSKRVQAAYDQMVEEYANRNHTCLADNLIRQAQQLLRQTGAQAQLLDIGCGTGRDMAWLEARGATVTGIDLSSKMLAYARHYVAGALIQMPMQALAFCASRFDGAWCCASLLHLPKHEAPGALKEIRRVLKLNGSLVLSIQAGSGEGWEESYVAGASRFFARYTSGEMTALLKQSNFAVQAIESSNVGARDWLSFRCLAG